MTGRPRRTALFGLGLAALGAALLLAVMGGGSPSVPSSAGSSGNHRENRQSPGSPAQRGSARLSDRSPWGTGPTPTTPSLPVEGAPGIGPGDPEDPNRNRNPSRYPPPPIVPPEVRDRPDGAPPSPQGGPGRAALAEHARLGAAHSGLQEEAPQVADPVKDRVAREGAAGTMATMLPSLAACLRHVPTLRGQRSTLLQVTLEQEPDDASRGFASALVVPGVDELPPAAEDCLAVAVADLGLPAPSGPPLVVELTVPL